MTPVFHNVGNITMITNNDLETDLPLFVGLICTELWEISMDVASVDWSHAQMNLETGAGQCALQCPLVSFLTSGPRSYEYFILAAIYWPAPGSRFKDLDQGTRLYDEY